MGIRPNRICEERGTGFQKVVQSVELFGLQPVVFTPLENAFRVTLCAPKALGWSGGKNITIRNCFKLHEIPPMIYEMEMAVKKLIDVPENT